MINIWIVLLLRVYIYQKQYKSMGKMKQFWECFLLSIIHANETVLQKKPFHLLEDSATAHSLSSITMGKWELLIL